MVCLLLLVASVLSRRTVAEEHERFVVSKDGQARCAIVVKKERATLAAELQEWLRDVTGATLPIKAEPKPSAASGLLMGTAEDFPERARKERMAELGPEGFVVRSERERLWMLANTPLGLQHAVYTLLDAVGCRWYFPDPVWTVVPKEPNLTVAMNLRARPCFAYRRIWYGWGPRTPKLRRDYEAWQKRNRQLGHFRVDCGHAYERHLSRRHFKEHPDWFALVKGERKPTQLCVSNPEVQRRMVQSILNAFRKHPESKMVSVEPNDGGGYCECERCAALGSASDGAFHLANVVAKAVRREFPDKWVGLYAYALHSEPPRFPIEPGVYVQVTTGFRYTKLSFDEQVGAFRKLGARLGVYDYFSVYPWDRDMPGAAKAGRVYQLAEAIRHYRDLGLTTYDAESSCNWGPNGPGYWVGAKMMWDPDLAIEDLMRDFCTRAFGKAADPMRRLYDRWAKGERFSPRGLKLALLDLRQAYEREQEPGVRARLDRLAMYLHWLRLWVDYDRSARWNQWGKLVVASPDEIARRARQVIVYSRRLMDTGLIHAHPMLFTSWFKSRFRALEKIKGFDLKQADAWKKERTDIPSAEEVAQFFVADLKRFHDLSAVEIQEREFSEKLVPLAERLPEAVKAWGKVKRSPLFVESSLHYFVGSKGERLRLRYEPFDRGHTVDCHWTLKRPREAKPLAEGDVRAEKGQAVTVELTVPADGLFVFEPGTAYWKAAQVGFDARPLSVWAGRASRPGRPKRPPFRLWLPRRGQPLFFFVPEGTRHFVVGIASGGDPFTTLVLRTADGKKILEDRRVLSGDQVSVTVPRGKDGAVWSLTLSSLRCVVELHDVPPYLARRPAELLVPEETARRGD
jgi:hypothetical protein